MISHQAVQQEFQAWTQSTNFGPMGSSQLLQNFRAMVGQLDIDLASVLGARLTNDQILSYRSIDQADSAVVSDMKLFSQLADCDAFAVGKSPDGEQSLMLPRSKPGVLGS